jgi:hypothetical protein
MASITVLAGAPQGRLRCVENGRQPDWAPYPAAHTCGSPWQQGAGVGSDTPPGTRL